MDSLEERFAYGKFDKEELYHRLRTKKQEEIDQVKQQLLDSDSEISNLDLLKGLKEVIDYMSDHLSF